jgi:demethylmenaquinone methyltransferase / 2-methoxy-6-polyprenyl-1,4-benzoquinol methylase
MRKPLLAMFNTVPKRYDLVNRVLTLGFDERWRKQVAKACIDTKPDRVMDLCCGTGDMALHLARLAPASVEITGVDFSEPMLDVAWYKAEACGLASRVTFKTGDAADLPYENDYFDAITISYGFRNLTYKNPMRDKFLAEILRVMRPGGRFMILETCQPDITPIRKLYHFYLKKLSATMGALISGQKGAYKYLGQSAANYYNASEVCRLLLDGGFNSVQCKTLLWGIAAAYTAKKA